MTWLYQALPLASSPSAATDADEALDATSTTATSAAGSCGVDAQVALSGTAVACSSGAFNVEILATSVITSAAGSTTSANNSVRLRSRKTGGASGTASQELAGTTFIASAQTITRTVSVLLGGTGITCSAQTIPFKTNAHLLGGQQRTMSTGTMVGTGGAGTGLPSWVQVPTQTDELAYYATDFGPGSGKPAVWDVTTADRTPSVAQGGFSTPALPSSLEPHNDTEADDLWNHYQQYKRTGEQRYLDWAHLWRNYFVSTEYEADLRLTPPGGCGVPAVWHHLYLQGLCLWGKEQNDPVALAQAEYLMGHVEADSLAQVPGSSNMSGFESRNYGRRLINACWVSMINPISRWITLRDHLIDCWVQSTGWRDATHATQPTIIGGNHFCFTTSVQEGWNATTGANGLRFNHSFNMGIHNEALWLAYKLTGREDIKNMIIQMGRFVLHYGWDPAHANPFVGSRWGYRPLTGAGAASATLNGKSTPGFLHSYADEFITATPGVPQPAPYPTFNTNPDWATASNYEASQVNGLVYAYKLSGETPFLVRAREHWRKATQYEFAITTGSGNPKLSDTEVEHCMDTQRDSSASYVFAWNKGEQQYAAYLFENGGFVPLEPGVGGGTFVPPYAVPTAAGEVIPIGGISITDPNEAIMTGAFYGQTVWPTNFNTSINPAESLGTEILINNDSSCQFIASYSEGGAIVAAGGGGHAGRMNLGAILFDFQDGAWKRHWTGGSTVVNEANNWTDIQSGTKVHNVLHRQSEIIPYYNNSCGRVGCQNPAHWTPSAFQLSVCPRVSDNDQTWEISRSYDPNLGATHLFPDPANWGGLGTETIAGYILDGGFFVDPSPPGTLAPTQSSLPLPSHTWDLQFELPPEDGGGPKGSIVCSRHRNGGPHGQITLSWSHRFDLDTGIWHYASTNSSFGALGNPAGGAPYPAAATTAGAYDPVGKRYFMLDQNQLDSSQSGNRLNYWNASDQTWRNLSIGSSVGVVGGSAVRTENLMCDPDRRLLVMMSNETTGPDGPRIRVFDMSTVSGHDDPSAILVSGTGGFVDVMTGNWPWTHPFTGSYIGDYNIPFVYYPPNGKYYRFISRIHGGDPGSGRPDGLTVAQYWADPTKCNSDKLQRITPPPIIANPTAGYYTNPANWTVDEITLSRPIPRGNLTQSQRSVGLKWFKYVPALECLAWVPLNNSSPDPTARRPVYLIKPF